MISPITEAWNRISAWLQSHAPTTLQLLQPPATEEQLQHLATQTNLELPEDFKDFYRLMNGTDPEGNGCGLFPACDEWDEMAFSPLAVEKILQDWQLQKELLETGNFADLEAQPGDGIAPDWWNIGWIPFASNGGGDLYCIDLAPVPTGQKGQVIFYAHETGEHQLLAGSLADYLNDLAIALESNALNYDDRYGIGKKA